MSAGLKKLIAKLNKWHQSRNQAKQPVSVALSKDEVECVKKHENCVCRFCQGFYFELDTLVGMRQILEDQYCFSIGLHPNVVRDYPVMINNINKYIEFLNTQISLFFNTHAKLCEEIEAEKNIPPSPTANTTHIHQVGSLIERRQYALLKEMRKVCDKESYYLSDYNNCLTHAKDIFLNESEGNFECSWDGSCDFCEVVRTNFGHYGNESKEDRQQRDELDESCQSLNMTGGNISENDIKP